MSDGIVGLAAAMVRGWTRLYTARMHPALRDVRRAEIASDLWELRDEARRCGDAPILVAAHVIARLFFGLHADLLWRVEHVLNRGWPIRRSVFVAAAAAAFAAAFWAITLLRSAPLPLPPSPPRRFVSRLPPPPPPPPPPPRVDWWKERGLPPPTEPRR